MPQSNGHHFIFESGRMVFLDYNPNWIIGFSPEHADICRKYDFLMLEKNFVAMHNIEAEVHEEGMPILYSSREDAQKVIEEFQMMFPQVHFEPHEM